MQPDLISNPFALLSLIAAPAVLTNAASLLALSTSNRFLRAGERLRVIIAKIDQTPDPNERQFWIRHMSRIERQATLLLIGLRSVYVALGSFVLTSLVSIFGAYLSAQQLHPWDTTLTLLSLTTGLIGTIAIVHGCLNLFRATRLSLINIREEAQLIYQREKVHIDIVE